MMNRNTGAADLKSSGVQPFGQLRVMGTPNKGLAVVGNDNIDVGNSTPTRKPGQPIIENSVRRNGSSEQRIDPSNPVKRERPRSNGAMSQQSCDSGNQSAPQKFVRLVGCRDSKARPQPWVRPRAPG
jgi:hypothetical protein